MWISCAGAGTAADERALVCLFCRKEVQNQSRDYDAESAFCVRKELGSTMEGVATNPLGGGVNALNSWLRRRDGNRQERFSVDDFAEVPGRTPGQ